MKVTSLLLLGFVIVLSGQPVLGVMDVLPEVLCCHADEQEEHQEEESGDCSRACNPFLLCQCCPGVMVITGEQLTRYAPDQFAAQPGRVQDLTPLQIIFPIWHPPRI